MGASLGETRPFACSCLPFPGPQRPIKGTLMEDDKRQPTPLLSVCELTPLCLPSKNGPVFFFLLGGWQNIPPVPVLTPTLWCPNADKFARVKVWTQPHSVLEVAKRQYRDTKTSIMFSFISKVLKATKCNLAGGFRCTHLRYGAASNFRGVDRKQNMYYEVGDCHKWITGCQLEKKKNSQNAAYWEADPAHALLSWAQ